MGKPKIQTKTVFCLDCRPKIVISRKSRQKKLGVVMLGIYKGYTIPDKADIWHGMI
jgi:hypothetical protein